MKKLFAISSVILAFGLILSGCGKDDKDPVFDPAQTQKPSIVTPANGSEIVLLESQKDQPFIIEWSPAVYNLENLPATKYILQIDTANTFATAQTLISSENTKWETTVEGFNQKLINFGLSTGVAHDVYFRVNSFIVNNNGTESTYSEIAKFVVTPYSAAIYVKPIYLLGSATSAGWDNTKALPMTWIAGGQFAVVETLTPGDGQYIKFISVLGQWAPQWGTDASGTAEAGPLVYRPTESVPDPAAIPAPAELADYRIVADTLNLTYTVSKTSAQLYLLGDGTPAGWDNTAALPMTKVAPGIFEIQVQLGGDGKYLKFIEVLGQWAPQYGTDANGASDGGNLVYRPDESVQDPPAIPCPATAGTYTVRVNLATMTYTIK
ncbi:MAG: starch-binding outer membrane protein SusE/F [Bacteroidales bacterium]|nr:starch-binding outer membrane protein SusE/F [Bacteroidales bacterium]NPV36657.1 SusF/SusE family outer membrane protein [Bacteroidales bacterium]